MALNFFSRSDNDTERKSSSGLRALLDAAEKTQPSSNVRAVPIETLQDKAIRANNRVIDTSITLNKLEHYAAVTLDRLGLETAEAISALEKTLSDTRAELAEKIDKAQAALTAAEAARIEAQYALMHRHIEAGAFEGVRDFNKLVRLKSSTADSADA